MNWHLADMLLPIIPSTEGSAMMLFVRTSVSSINKEESKQHFYLQVGSQGVIKSIILYLLPGLNGGLKSGQNSSATETFSFN